MRLPRVANTPTQLRIDRYRRRIDGKVCTAHPTKCQGPGRVGCAHHCPRSAWIALLQLHRQVCVVEELFPGAVSLVAEVNVHEGVVLGPDGLLG